MTLCPSPPEVAKALAQGWKLKSIGLWGPRAAPLHPTPEEMPTGSILVADLSECCRWRFTSRWLLSLMLSQISFSRQPCPASCTERRLRLLHRTTCGQGARGAGSGAWGHSTASRRWHCPPFDMHIKKLAKRADDVWLLVAESGAIAERLLGDGGSLIML